MAEMNQKRILQLLRFRWLRKAFVGKLRFKWDTEYATGVWDYLGAPQQLNYNTLLGFLQKFGRQGAILEVGCGEGILQQRMPVGAYSKYLGIDVSRIAIKKAARGNNETTEYSQW
jgi:2-polyprenyl-3-methyl-5-hydroxy-6-metoxy-1,4-benzoquinol methylase